MHGSPIVRPATTPAPELGVEQAPALGTRPWPAPSYEEPSPAYRSIPYPESMNVYASPLAIPMSKLAPISFYQLNPGIYDIPYPQQTPSGIYESHYLQLAPIPPTSFGPARPRRYNFQTSEKIKQKFVSFLIKT